MTVQMRELNAKDTFAVIRLAKKLGISTAIVSLFKKREKANDLMREQKALIAKALGYEVVLSKNPDSKEAKQARIELDQSNVRIAELTEILNNESFSLIADLVELVIENIDGVEDDIYEFLGKLCGQSAEEFGSVSIVEFMGTLKAFFEKPELSKVVELFTQSKSAVESTSSETASTNVIPMQET